MDSISLKKYIFENHKIEYILKKIGCKYIVYHPNREYYSCSNYNGDNKTAINVKNNEYLSVINYTRAKEFNDNSDIISLVQYNKNISFRDALKYIHNILGLKFTWQRQLKNKNDNIPPELAIMKRIREKTKYGTIDVGDINVLDDEYLNDFVPRLHIDWYKEGIMPWTRDKFGLCYSYKYKRVIIPHRFWLTGELIGTNARTTVANYEEFGIKKYYLTKGFNKHLNLYGLWENHDSIQKAGYVVVYEAEKSVLKRDSLCDSTGVAVSGHSLSQEQVAILIGLNVDIVIAVDNDIQIEEIRYLCSKFYHIRNVYYIKDKWNLLDKKDSPADKGDKIYSFLFKNKTKFDANEYNKYLEDLKTN